MTEHDLALTPMAAEDARPRAEQLLRRAACQLAAVHAAGIGMVLGPTLDDRVATLERAREELLQLEQAEALYGELTSESLLQAAEQRIARLPQPTDWTETSLARLFVCLSARIELELLCERGRVDAYRVAREMEHVNAAHAALLEDASRASRAVDLSSPFAAAWLELGLQALDSDLARARYLAALEREFGLAFPN